MTEGLSTQGNNHPARLWVPLMKLPMDPVFPRDSWSDRRFDRATEEYTSRAEAGEERPNTGGSGVPSTLNRPSTQTPQVQITVGSAQLLMGALGISAFLAPCSPPSPRA
jgi:hypothetical protein